MGRKEQLLYKFGLTEEAWSAIFADQNGKCALCLTHSSHLKRTLHVDHCHKTGKVRGLLCDGCNVMLGRAKDDPTTLRRAADYLEKQ